MADDFTLKTLNDMIARMPRPRMGYVADQLTVGHRMYDDIRKNTLVYEPIGAETFYGVPIQVSPLVPYVQTCGACGGTGEGKDRTYCPVCRGGGKYTVEGMVTARNGPMTMMLTYHKKRFEPRWPRDVRVPLRPLGEL